MKNDLNPVNFAIVGPGRMGRLYARMISEAATARLVALCGNRADSTQAAAHEYNVPGYADGRYQAMLDAHPEIEAVIVAASEWAHLDPVLAALDAGKQVLVEKPMAISPTAAAAMVERAAAQGVHLMVCHSLRFDLRFAALRQAVSEGAVGEVLHLYARRNAPQIAVERVLGRFPLAYWLAPHDIDMLLWTTGSPVRKVMAYSHAGGKERQDFIIAILTFANGAIGVLESSWATPAVSGQPLTEQFTVRGTTGMVELLSNQTGVGVYRAGAAPEYPDLGYTPVLHDQQEGMFRRLLQHFIGVVRNQCSPVVTGADGLAAIRVAAAIDESLHAGREITLNEE